jgi:hypothetical protein
MSGLAAAVVVSRQASHGCRLRHRGEIRCGAVSILSPVCCCERSSWSGRLFLPRCADVREGGDVRSCVLWRVVYSRSSHVHDGVAVPSGSRPHGAAATARWFPVSFRPPAFASWTSCSRQRVPLSSRSAYQPAKGGPDSVEVSVFRTHETRPGWVPSLPRGGGVLPTSAASPVGACRFPTASPIPR